MKKIEWKMTGDGLFATTGNINLACRCQSIDEEKNWFACVYFRHLAIYSRRGPTRDSLEKAQKDVIFLVRELLMDSYFIIGHEMKNFDLFETDD